MTIRSTLKKLKFKIIPEIEVDRKLGDKRINIYARRMVGFDADYGVLVETGKQGERSIELFGDFEDILSRDDLEVEEKKILIEVAKKISDPLYKITFYIDSDELLCLAALREKAGLLAEIIDTIGIDYNDTYGALGRLYTKDLVDMKWIEEQRTRFYSLSELGKELIGILEMNGLFCNMVERIERRKS